MSQIKIQHAIGVFEYFRNQTRSQICYVNKTLNLVVVLYFGNVSYNILTFCLITEVFKYAYCGLYFDQTHDSKIGSNYLGF